MADLSAVDVKLNGTSIKSSVDWTTLEVSQTLTKEVSKLSFGIKITPKTTVPNKTDQLDVYINDSAGNVYHYFGGQVVETEVNVLGGIQLMVSVTALDWSFTLDSKLVNQIYRNMDPHDIVLDILNKYTDGSFTTAGVQTYHANIPSITFNFSSVTKALQQLANLIGWEWNVTPGKDVFFGSTLINPAPFAITDSNGNLNWPSIDFDQDVSNMKNSVYVIGSTYTKTFDAATTRDSYQTDGINATFPLAYSYINQALTDTTPADPVFVTLDGANQTVGVDQQDDPTGFQVMYNQAEKFVHFNSLPGSGHTVKVFGDAIIPIVANAQNPVAVALYGEKQDVIVDKNITTVTEAFLRAQAQVAQYGDIVNTIRFDTLLPGLFTGQQLTLNSSIFSTGSLSLIIRRVTLVSYTPFKMKFQVECYSTDKVTFVDVMTLLLRQQLNGNSVADNTVLEVLIPLIETLSSVDAVTLSSVTFPYQWGPTGSPMAVANFSRWG